jgi:hypothetical protein
MTMTRFTRKIPLLSFLVLLALLIPALVALAAPSGPDQVIEFTGPVQQKPDAGLGAWQIADRQVLAVPGTRILPDPAAIHLGDTARVVAHRRNDTLVAQMIAKVAPPQHVVQGRIDAIADAQWTIGGQVVLLNAETVVEGDHPDVGDLAMARVLRTDAGLLATRILVHDPPPPRPEAIHGRIEAMAADKWMIGEHEVLIDAETVIEGDHPDVGDMAVAFVLRTPAGLLAKRIQVHDPRPPQPAMIRGKIEAMAADKWTIGEHEVLIDAETVIEGDPADVGDFAVAQVVRTPAGPLAKQIRVWDERPDGRPVVFRGVVTDIQADSWKVLVGEEEKAVAIDEHTRIAGDPAVGDPVGVKAVQLADGTLLAQLIVKLDDDHEDETAFMGFVTETLPSVQEDPPMWVWVVTLLPRADEPTRTWTVIVDANTEINVDPATVAVGAWVKGAGTRMDDDTVQAKVVRVTPPPRLPFHGEVSERPDASAPDFPQGKWVIGGMTVYVTAETRIQGEPPAVGAKASGFGELMPDGALKALMLSGR